MLSTLLADVAVVVDAAAVEAEVAVEAKAVVELEEADAAEAADATKAEHEEVVVVEVVEDDSHATTMDFSAMVCPITNGAPLASPQE